MTSGALNGSSCPCALLAIVTWLLTVYCTTLCSSGFLFGLLVLSFLFVVWFLAYDLIPCLSSLHFNSVLKLE